MKVINQYNGLNGAIQTRAQLQQLLNEARENEQLHIAKKLEKVLANYPDKNEFDIELSQPEIEMLPEDLQRQLDYLPLPEDDENIGLGKAVSPDDIYQMITDKMLKLIDKASGKNYKTKWKKKGYLIPFNFVSKKPYRGINNVMLSGFATQALENPYFLTFKQIQKLGGKLKKGSRGEEVVYFTRLFKYEQAEPKLYFGTYDFKKMVNWLKKNKSKISMLDKIPAESVAAQSAIPILKYYNVFNGADVEGIDFDLDNFTIGYFDNGVKGNNDSRINIAEAMVKAYPKPAPKIQHEGQKAFYNFIDDFIQLPEFKNFETGLDYYRTLFHEITHSTGAAKRLDRNIANKFGSKDYAKEELVAEFGAVFLSAQAGIIWRNQTNHSEYLANWKNALKHLKADNRLLMRAASEAQKAADFVLDLNEKGEAAHLKELQKIVEQKEQARVEEKAQQAKEAKAKAIDEKLEKLEAQLEKATTKSKTEKDLEKKIAQLENSLDKLNISVNKKQPAKAKRQPKKATPTPKVNKETGQYALLGATSCNSDKTAPVEHSNPNSLAARKTQMANRTFEYYKIEDPEIAKFLGQVEIKERESVGISITAPQGAGKTRFLFQLINAFAKNYRVGHASIEEHPESSLFFNKVDEYIDDENLSNIEAPEITSMQDLHELIMRNDVIAIDSFEKLKELNSKLEVDKDLRKKYHGKLFILIFQLTSTGKMRGGSKSQFDVDIVLFTEKFDDYRQNYIYPDKNRYNQIPPSQLKFSIYHKKILASGEQEQENESKTQFENLVAKRV